MIFDKIENWKIYFKAPIFIKIFENLKYININTPNGIYFKNDKYYFKVMSYSTIEEPNVIENHKKEVDIQILLSGSEKIKLYSLDSVETIREYSKDDDNEFYKNKLDNNSEIILKPDFMGVFFNQDIHHPQFAVNNKSEKIKKIVIKINEKFFT